MADQLRIPCEELRRLYEGEGLGVAEVGAALGRSASTVSNWLRRCGIRTRSGRFRRAEVPRDLLEQLYSYEQLPLRAIAARLGISVGTVNNRLRAFAIERRGRRGAVQRAAVSEAGERGSR